MTSPKIVPGAATHIQGTLPCPEPWALLLFVLQPQPQCGWQLIHSEAHRLIERADGSSLKECGTAGGFQAASWAGRGLSSCALQCHPVMPAHPLWRLPLVSPTLGGVATEPQTELRRESSPMSSSEMLWSFAFSKKEHILMRNQNLVGLKLPELSEAAEQEKGRWGWGRCSPQTRPGFVFARSRKVTV